MKKSLKFLALVLVVSVFFSMSIACRRGDGTVIDTSRTQLTVGVYTGAYKDEVSQETIKRFEELYKDVEFEKGKKGVQVVVSPDGKYLGTTLTGVSHNYTPEVFLTETCYYYDLVAAGDLLEITDVVTSSMQYDFVTKQTYADRENTTFRDKMENGYDDYLNVGTDENPKYYAVPNDQTFYGLIYDINLFEDNLLYFAEDQSDDPFIENINQTRSAGPDGEKGTYDDGLPATYEEFYSLCDRMIESKIIPILYPGAAPQYVTAFLAELWADYEGRDQFMLNYKMDGSMATDLISVSDDGKVTKEADVAINGDNGYLTYSKQAGRYYSLKFLETLLTSKHNNTGYFDPDLNGLSHITAHDKFVGSKYEGAKAIGMMVDGVWWAKEAKDTIDRYTNEKGLKPEDKKWGVMPLPKADETKLGASTRVDVNYSLGFIKASCPEEKIPVAKAFLQFIATEQSLREFTNEFGLFKAYKMNIDENSEFYKGLPYYTQYLWQIHENDDILIPCDNNDKYKQIAADTSLILHGWDSIIDNVPRQDPVSVLGKGSITAEQYFNGLYKNYLNVWQ